MISKAAFLAFAAISLGAGCILARPTDNTVLRRTGARAALVRLSDPGKEPGDRVLLSERQCWRSRGGATCKEESVGRGTLIKVLNEREAIILVDPGVPFSEGTRVKRHPKQSRLRPSPGPNEGGTPPARRQFVHAESW